MKVYDFMVVYFCIRFARHIVMLMIVTKSFGLTFRLATLKWWCHQTVHVAHNILNYIEP